MVERFFHKGVLARKCPRDGKICACRFDDCPIDRAEKLAYVFETLSQDERLRWAEERGILEWRDFASNPKYGTAFPGQIVRHHGRYWECVYKREVTVTAADEPGKPRYCIIWSPVPGEINERYGLDVPIVPKSSPRYKWLRGRMNEITRRWRRKQEQRCGAS